MIKNMTFYVFNLDFLKDMFELLYILFLIGMGTLIYRWLFDFKDCWYFNIISNKDRYINITKEAWDFYIIHNSCEYYNGFIRRSAYAILWFFVTWLITIMAVVGGSYIVDKNPMFKLPCIILVIIMQFIMISKPVLIIAEVIEHGFCTLILLRIAKIQDEEPMRIRESKIGHQQNKKYERSKK